MPRPTSAPRRYAEAAFEIAERDAALDDWGEGLALAATLVEDPGVLPMVGSPTRPLAERLRIVEQLLKGRVPDGVLRLTGLLVERGRIEQLPQVAREYRRILERQRGVVEARVTSAAPLTPDETEAVREWVSRKTGKTVALSATVDASLIGGLTVRVGDTLLDASVRGRLERLRNDLLSGVRSA